MQREQKITLGEMRQSGGPTRLLAGFRRKNHRETRRSHQPKKPTGLSWRASYRLLTPAGALGPTRDCREDTELQLTKCGGPLVAVTLLLFCLGHWFSHAVLCSTSRGRSSIGAGLCRGTTTGTARITRLGHGSGSGQG